MSASEINYNQKKISDKIYLFSKIYILYLIFAYIFFLKIHLFEFPNKYVFSDWLINYNGGYIRRGLLGQIIFEISLFTNTKFEYLIFLFQISGYLLYFFLFFNFIKKIKLDFFWILIIFSTISFLYPVSELESLGRKDIYVILFFFLFTQIYYTNLKHLILFFIFFFSISVLTHEISFFYIFFYLFFIYLKNFFYFKEKFKINYILLIIVCLIILLYLNIFLSKEANILEIIASYNSKDINNIAGAFFWLSKPFENHFEIVVSKFTFAGVIRYFLIIAINIAVLLYFSKLNRSIYICSKKITIKHFFILLFFSTIPIYFMALDWGRITYISFNFYIILIIFLYNKNLLNLRYTRLQIKKISIKKKITIFFIVCVIFSPKILLTDKYSGVPIYKLTTKIIKRLL